MGTKRTPGKFDCYTNAKPDEPMFTLLGRDKAAARAVRYWVLERIKTGKNRASDSQIIEAYEIALAMEAYELQRHSIEAGADLV